jgi:DNA helicase HerA-like ATPase
MTTIDASIAIIFNILGKPTGITGSSTTNSITVNWSAPVFASLLGLTGYQIEILDPADDYALVGTAENVSASTTTYTTPATLTGATLYRIRVTSITSYTNTSNIIDQSTL